MPLKSPKLHALRYSVIRDTREQAGQGWSLAPSKHCTGTTIGKLATGDYTIVGHETSFVIERKGSIGEFAGNIYQARFEAELARLASFTHAFLVFEFTLEDIFQFPASSDIPRSKWEDLRITPAVFLMRICELQQKYPRVQFIFAGGRGKAFASSQFKRLLEAENQAVRKAGQIRGQGGGMRPPAVYESPRKGFSMSSSARRARSVLSRLDSRMHRAMAGSLNRSVDLVTGRLEAYVPKDTGELADSIDVDHAAGTLTATVTIGNPDEPGQAAAIEFGTASVVPAPYFRPACNRPIPSAKAEIHTSLRKAL